MTWFKVDDSFHAHPKVLATSPAALGLWVVAGAWSSANLTEGLVPDHALSRLLPDAGLLAKELATAGLWRRERGGYRFHDWIDYNPTREEATAAKEKQSSGGAIGNHRRWHVDRGVRDPKCRYCQGKQSSGTDRPPDQVPEGGTESGASRPSRPDPSRPQGGLGPYVTTDRATQQPPPPRCEEHLDNPDPPPCGRCADARKTRNRWETDRAARTRDAPHCRRHRGQPAHNCAPCRSEQLAERGTP